MLKRFYSHFLPLSGLSCRAPSRWHCSRHRPPAPAAAPGCDRDLTEAEDNVAVMRSARLFSGSVAGPEMCRATQRYFFELKRARRHCAVREWSGARPPSRPFSTPTRRKLTKRSPHAAHDKKILA